jgi:heme O synthase-like polyprenyltransferase
MCNRLRLSSSHTAASCFHTPGLYDPGAWVLFAILFVWQLPHFLALAWMYRDDYARGGYKMLPVLDPHVEHSHHVHVVTSL